MLSSRLASRFSESPKKRCLPRSPPVSCRSGRNSLSASGRLFWLRTTSTRSTGFPLPSPASLQTSPSSSINCGALISRRPCSTQSAKSFRISAPTSRSLQTTTLEKVSAETKREAMVEATFAAHREFDAIWEPRFADMRGKVLRLQRALVSPNESQQDRRAELNSLDQAILALLPLEQIRRDFSVTFETALRASATSDPRELAEFKNQAQRSIRSIDGLVSDINPDLSTELFRPIARLRANVRGETNIFGLRQTEIERTAKSKQLIAENTALSAHLHNSVEQLLASSREDIDTAALVAKRAQQFNTNVLLSVSALAVISSFLIVWLYVGRSIVARLTQLSGAMLSIAAGRREIPVPATGSDEVAAMGRAVEVFRQNAPTPPSAWKSSWRSAHPNCNGAERSCVSPSTTWNMAY